MAGVFHPSWWCLQGHDAWCIIWSGIQIRNEYTACHFTGFIAKILVPDGAKDIDIGVPVAIVVEDAASVAAFKGYSGDAKAAKPAPVAPKAAAPKAAAAAAKPAAAKAAAGAGGVAAVSVALCSCLPRRAVEMSRC